MLLSFIFRDCNVNEIYLFKKILRHRHYCLILLFKVKYKKMQPVCLISVSSGSAPLSGVPLVSNHQLLIYVVNMMVIMVIMGNETHE